MNADHKADAIVYEWLDFLQSIYEGHLRVDNLERQWAAMTNQARHSPYADVLGKELAETTADLLMREEFIEDCDREWGKRFPS